MNTNLSAYVVVIKAISLIIHLNRREKMIPKIYHSFIIMFFFMTVFTVWVNYWVDPESMPRIDHLIKIIK